MGVQFHHLKVGTPSGKVEMALELIPTFRSPLGSDVLKRTTGEPSAGCLRVGVTTGRSGSGLCPTRDRPDQVGFQIFRPAANQSENRIRRFLPESGQVSIGVDYLENGENPAKKI